MSMLDYNEILPKKVIIMDGDPYQVLSAHVFRKQQRKPVNQTKLRNLKSGKVTEHAFHQSESIPEADIETKTVVYIYSAKGEAWFHDVGNPSERYTISESVVGDQIKYLKPKTESTAMVFNEEIIGLDMPVKVELMVKEAPPGIKGDSAQGGTKVVVLETGANVNVPLFINEGDIIRINTESGQYVERVGKK